MSKRFFECDEMMCDNAFSSGPSLLATAAAALGAVYFAFMA